MKCVSIYLMHPLRLAKVTACLTGKDSLSSFSSFLFSNYCMKNCVRLGMPLWGGTLLGLATLAHPAAAQVSDTPDIQVFSSSSQKTQPYLSINLATGYLLLAANTATPPPIRLQQGYYYSNDDGNTWSGQDLLPNNGRTFGDQAYGNSPSTAIGTDGQAYIGTDTPGTYASHGFPDGYFVQSSSNNGASWSNQVVGAGPGEYWLHPRLTADNNSPSTSSYASRLYCTWFSGYQQPSAPAIMFNYRAPNQTFTTPQYISNYYEPGDGPTVATGINGEVFVAWASYVGSSFATGVGFNKSLDGGATFGTATQAFAYTGISNWSYGTPGINATFGNTVINDYPSIAVDKSCRHPNRIYIAFPTRASGKGTIDVRYSDNNGTSWSAATTVSLAAGRQSWHPTIAVDDVTGDVSVIYSCFDTASGFVTNTYVAHSADGTSYQNIKVSDVSHLTRGVPYYNGGYLGAHSAIVAHGGKAYPVWSDNRTGTWQLYLSKLNYYQIAGPTLVCTDGSTFSITSALPPGATVNWGVQGSDIASNFTVYRGTGPTFYTSARLNGPGTINASISICGKTIIPAPLQVNTQNYACGVGTESRVALSAPAPAASSASSAPLFSVYPNPASDVLWVRLPASESATASESPSQVARIYKSNGQLVKQWALSADQPEQKINVDNFASGLYYIVLTDNQSITNRRAFVVQH